MFKGFSPLIFLLVSPLAIAAPAADAQRPRVADITFRGLAQTDESFVRRELGVENLQPFEPSQLEQGVRRLRNLRVFREVTAVVTARAEGWVDIEVTIVEKQTLLPFFRLKQGGGSRLAVLGLGDLNSFGRAIEILGSYENLNTRWHGGRLEFRAPHAWNLKNSVAGEAALETRIHSREIAQDQTIRWRRQSRSARLTWEHEPASGWRLAPTLALSHEVNSQESGEIPTGFSLPQRTSPLQFSLKLERDALSWLDFRVHGWSLAPSISAINQQKETFLVAQFLAKSFFSLNSHLDAAARFNIQSANPGGQTARLKECTVGGFSEVRGFWDERVSGRACWYFNVETRWTAWQDPWIVLQPTLFSDAGGAQGGRVSHPESPLSSAGGGIRIIFPSLARLALRLDYAFRLGGPKDDAPLSIGSQQFF